VLSPCSSSQASATAHDYAVPSLRSTGMHLTPATSSGDPRNLSGDVLATLRRSICLPAGAAIGGSRQPWAAVRPPIEGCPYQWPSLSPCPRS
jgi:hypothetical protein